MTEPEFTDAQRARYVELLRSTGNRSVSARAIGHGPGFITRWRQVDDTFDADCREAEQEAADMLEDAARKRAVDGVIREKVIGSGDNARHIEEVQYSDMLLIRLLEANKPDKFANRSKTELSNPDGTLAPSLTEQELATRLASFLALAEARRAAANGNDLGDLI